MKVLLTGAAGFIGAHVTRRLIAGGDEVLAVLRPQSRPWRLQDILPAVRVLECDLTDPDQTRACVERAQPEACIHLAWYVEPGRYLESPENLRWVQASLTLAAALAAQGCRRLVAAGTCLEYRASDDPLSEDEAVAPGSLYAAAKLGLGLMLSRLGAVAGMQTSWLRLFYLFGPLEDERRLVPSVIKALLSDRDARVTSGRQIRDFLHVEDLAAAICAVARSGLSGPINVGSGRPVAIRDVVTTLGVILGRPDRIVWNAIPDDPAAAPRLCANVQRLVDGAGWSPRYDLESGLRDTVDWWRARLGPGARPA